MIDRYTLPRMKAIWEPENKFRTWLKVEILICEGQAKIGMMPEEAVGRIKGRALVDVRKIDRIEQTVKHDVIAFLASISEELGEDAKYIHRGITSSDIIDTSLALQMKEAADIIIDDLKRLLKILKDRAIKYKETVMIGRSHGIHGEPITFGFKMALWYAEAWRNLKRMESAKDDISYGKISGAMGTFAHLPPSVESYVLKGLGLRQEPISSQIIQRDRHAQYLATLAIIASSIDKFATEIRHLQRTGVLEAEEFFSEGQRGSSAMPHKRNPISCENLSGLARIVRANSFASLEDIPLWHERDISHSSVERVIIPDSTTLVDYMLNKFIDILDKLLVYPANMMKNLELTGGLIYSERVMLELAKKGMDKDTAYRRVQGHAMAAWRGTGKFLDLLTDDPEIRKYLTYKEISDCFDNAYYIRNLDEIYQRVFKNE